MTRERERSLVVDTAAAPTSFSGGCCPICFDEYEPEDEDEAEIDLDLALTSPTRFGSAADIETGGVVVVTVAAPRSISDGDDQGNDVNIECSFSSEDARRDHDSEKRRDRNDRKRRRQRHSRHRRVELDPCRHHYCSDCLESYFVHSIQVRYVPIPCPSAGSNNDCQTSVALTSVLGVLGGGESRPNDKDNTTHEEDEDDSGTTDSETRDVEAASNSQRQDLMRKLVRLHRLHDEPNLRCCPHCDELLVEGTAGAAAGAASAGEASSPPSIPPGGNDDCDDQDGVETALCPSCGRGLDVRGPTSPDGKSSHPDELRATEEWIFKSTKPCSHCRAPIHKDSGCDHVVCPNCHDDMCYNCGSHVHLTGRTIRTCTQCRRSYVDHRHNREYRCRLLLLLPLMVPGWILYVLTMSIFSVLTGCFCGFFLCGTMESNPNVFEDGIILHEPDDDEREGGAAVIRPTDSTLTAATAATNQSAGQHHPNTDKTTSLSPPSPSPPSAPLAPLLGIRRTIGYIGLPVLVYMGDLGVGGCTRWVEELETTSATVMEAASTAVTTTHA